MRAFLCAAALAASAGGPARAEGTEVMVFAAASTANAIQDVISLYGARGADRVVASFAASSALARQIENGAPADIYISANPRWMDHLDGAGLIEAASRRDLLGNRLVLIAPADSPVNVDLSAKPALDFLLGDGRLALADPAYVPAGQYARAALEALGLWPAVAGAVAPMNNVRAALVLVERGEAPLGVVYATDAAITEGVRVAGVFPESSHPPITYPVAIVAGRETVAVRAFHDFLFADAARAVFAAHGFVVK
jgi:molybdate transport system substrate-binding protein